MIKNHLSVIYEELLHLKNEGVQEVYIEEDTLKNFLKHFNQEETKAKPSDEIISEPLSKKKQAPIRQPKTTEPKEKSFPPPPSFNIPNGNKEEQWNWLREYVLNSEVCKSQLKPDKKIVFGVGNLNADIFFCGEAPGADEEIQGEPFVGKAGQLLTKMILAMGLSREKVYIGNIMNFRPFMPTPYGNRPPTQEEMEYCLPFLKAQLSIIKPKIIVALGATAVSGLLGFDSKRRMSDIRGKWHEFEKIPLMITFHPSYLLRNNTMRTKRLVWEDLLQVLDKLDYPVTEKQRNFFITK